MKREFIAANEIGVFWTQRRIHCHTFSISVNWVECKRFCLCTYIDYLLSRLKAKDRVNLIEKLKGGAIRSGHVPRLQVSFKDDEQEIVILYFSSDINNCLIISKLILCLKIMYEIMM